VRLAPAELPPDLLLLPVILAGEKIVVFAVLLLLEEVGSKVDVVTLAVLLTTDPAGVLERALTVSVNCAEVLLARDANEQETVPVSPGSGSVQLMPGPVSCVRETKTRDDGNVSVQVRLSAASGPALATVIV